MLILFNRVKGFLPAFATLVFVVLVFIVAPSAVFVHGPGAPNPEGLKTWWTNFSATFITNVEQQWRIPLAALVTIICYEFLYRRGELKRVVMPLRNNGIGRQLLKWFIVCFIISVFLILPYGWGSVGKFVSALLNNPGGLFAIVTGCASVAGVYFTLASVLEVRNTIQSFSDYVTRAKALIEDTDPDDYIRLIVHTPATGCLVLPPAVWKSLSSLLQTSDRHFSILCLSDQQQETWFDSYKIGLDGARLADMERRIGLGMMESKLIKECVQRRAEMYVGDNFLGVVETTWDRLPKFYAVANGKRAIVVLPFFLPDPGSNIFASTVHRRNVHMIGFETSNFHIVDTVLEEFEIRRAALSAMAVVSAPADPRIEIAPLL